jgi:hypothetical protein
MPDNKQVHECEWEIGPLVQDLKLRLWANYWEDETGTQPAKHIVSASEKFFVQVCWELLGNLKRHFCGIWRVKIDLESIGTAGEYSSECVKIDMDPCRNDPYCWTFEVDVTKLKPDECGTVYLVAVTLSSLDPCGGPGQIWGYCKGPSVMFVP